MSLKRPFVSKSDVKQWFTTTMFLRLGMSECKFPRYAERPLLGQWRKTLLITHHSLSSTICYHWLCSNFTWDSPYNPSKTKCQKSFIIKLYSETQVSGRLGMSGGISPRHAQNPLSGERRKTLSITHHALSPPPSHHHLYVKQSDVKQLFTTTTTIKNKMADGSHLEDNRYRGGGGGGALKNIIDIGGASSL